MSISCAGVPVNNIVCLDSVNFAICGANGVASGTLSCATGSLTGLGLVCCQNLNQCGWPGCKQGVGLPIAVATPTATGTTQLPANGPTPDFCDTQVHDYDHMGKFCVGSRSNMWCKDGQLSRINFCPTEQICCENTGECGVPSNNAQSPCYVPKGIPQRNAGCVGSVNSCDDLADGARVCTGSNTFSYCLDQKVFAPLNQACPPGKQCCPLLGGRCEEDCTYPTQPVGHCDDQADGATVCNGYRSYKVCHNGGCLGTFDCIGANMVCCPTTGQCAKKTDCDQSQFYPVVDTTCKGLINKRVCSNDKQYVNVCLGGHLVAKFPIGPAYNFGCDNDVVSPDSTLYN